LWLGEEWGDRQLVGRAVAIPSSRLRWHLPLHNSREWVEGAGARRAGFLCRVRAKPMLWSSLWCEKERERHEQVWRSERESGVWRGERETCG